MKKTLIAVAAAAALTTSAFAEITFGAWGRTAIVPLANNGEKTVAGQTNAWGDWGRTAGLSINGSDADGKAGFAMEYRTDVTGERQGSDNAHFWIRPVDSVKVIAGKVEYNALRGNACLPGWDALRCSFEVGEDLLFKNYLNTGVLVEYANDALTAFVAVPLTRDFNTKYSNYWDAIGTTKSDADGQDDQASNVYARSQAGVMYKIDGTGVVKAQFIGQNKKDANDKKYTGDVEASFELTAVENLWVGVGVTYPIVDKDYVMTLIAADKEAPMDTKIGLGASYKVSDELKVMANGKVLIGTNVDSDADLKPGFQFGVGADYKIDDGLNFVAEVNYLAERKAGDDKLNESSVFVMGGLNKAVGAANVFCGFEMQTNVASGAWGLKSIRNTKDDKATQWAVPVVITLGL